MRDGKQLLLDSRPYAHEHRATSWWVLLSTLSLFLLLQAVIVAVDNLPIRIVASLAAGMVMIRMFIIYHDYEHGTILTRSRIAWIIMSVWGILSLNPPSIWRRSHNHHHKHNSKMYGASIGSFPMMTTDQYAAATPTERLAYRVTRHPLIFVFGYLTVFLYGMCIRSVIANPRQHADSAFSLVVHILIVAFLAWCGLDILLLCLMLPAALSSMMGAYLFYAQHNFPGAHVQPAKEWDYVTAALRSSSYMKMNPIMAWLTGNIGYHHVHHLNHHIPFYRLPETMAAFEELQSPGVTTLLPWDVYACLRLKVWDTERGCLTPFPTRSKRAAVRSKAKAKAESVSDTAARP
ncbi:MAG: fatty acid desaturase [Phycisphaera sp.]|nr:fatty acid desaturase [Phycisphaera sp.]